MRVFREDIRFSDGGVLAFFRSWNPGGCSCFAANFFYCLRLPFKQRVMEVTKIPWATSICYSRNGAADLWEFFNDNFD